ncbi:MAG: VWA domain-containing protein [Gammaproteobacteria bacterium]|nr:VWA domain-containing protein [Gammaproteobacteria bacterium]
MSDPDLRLYRDQLKCNFPQLEDVFEDCIHDALRQLSTLGVKHYLDGATLVCMIGRGFEPVLIYLEEMPDIANRLGEEMLEEVSQAVWKLSRTPNGAAIPDFMQCLPEASRRLCCYDQMQLFFRLIFEMMERTTSSIHGFHSTIPSPGLPDLLRQIPYLLSQLSLEGLKNWIDYGCRNYRDNPDRQRDYFSLQAADSRAVLSRERHGTLYIDNERKLDLYLRSIWQDEHYFVPYSLGFDELRKPQPYYDHLGIRVPDVYDDSNGVAGIDRYRLLIAHIAAHRRWSSAIVADNFSPFQRVAIETFEDCRVDLLMLRELPGMRPILLALHPSPVEGSCNPHEESCIRHRLAMLSRAILDPDHGYQHPIVNKFAQQLIEILTLDEANTQMMADLAISFTAQTRLQSDQAPKVRFKDTEVDYRDDNRHLWIFIEEGDEEETFSEKREASAKEEEVKGLPPRHYREWDYQTSSYKPDWVSLYESIHPSGESSAIDRLLAKHEALAKQLKRILDLLKPQQYQRIRYQEEGSELDLDVAIRSLIDYKCGAQPDPRINMSHIHNGRDIAVMVLLDLSASLNEIPDGCEQTILELSQEAVSLLAWTIDQLGDPLAIAGFHSDTRHNVRYYHIKGYSEAWGDQVKGRLAAMDAGFSTRMGAAIRHASHYLGSQSAEKKLLLILTDGEPSDIDTSHDESYLVHDAKKAIDELENQGISSYCITLDKKADDYIQDIFGPNGYTIIDRVERLPEKLPLLFTHLTS